ncbi:MAG: hypothetical protein ABW199_09050 [Caulobacterales bacterium]
MSVQRPRSSTPWIAVLCAGIFVGLAAMGAMMAMPHEEQDIARLTLTPPAVEEPDLPSLPPTLPDMPLRPG